MRTLLFTLIMMGLISCNNEKTTDKPITATGNKPTGEKITLTDCPGSENMIVKEADALVMIDHFESTFRSDRAMPRRTIDSLSKAVWISKCAIEGLNTILQSTGNLDGVRVYFASYKDSVARGQRYDNQATIILVPTENAGMNRHTDNWKIIPDNFILRGGYNHGELCPDSCNVTAR
jgi:hypothetical protein